MADDPYAILGVPRDATDEDIRRTFRRLAGRAALDLNPANKMASEERFKKVSGAYELLGDGEAPRLRPRRDRCGASRAVASTARTPAPTPRERAPWRAALEEPGFGDIFADLFGGPRPAARNGFGMRGQDARYTLEVDFVEAVEGARKRHAARKAACSTSTCRRASPTAKLRLKGKGAPGLRGGEPGDALVEIKVRARMRS